MILISIGSTLLFAIALISWMKEASNNNKLSDKNKLLSEDNNKLSNLVLDYQNENLLMLEEHQETQEVIKAARLDRAMECSARQALLPKFLKEYLPESICVPPKSKVDELLDKIENEMEVTGCSSRMYSDKDFNKKFEGLSPLVTLELNNGVIKMTDCALHPNWKIDLIYNDSIFTNLTIEQHERLKGIFLNKMAEAAIRDASKSAYGPEYSGCEQISPGIYTLKTNE